MEKILKSKIFLILSFLIFLTSCASIKRAEYFVPDAPVGGQEGQSLGHQEQGQQEQTSLENSEIIKIVQISDLHSNSYGKNQEKLIKKILAAQPDLIVFTGDIFDFEWPVEIAVERVEKILSAIKEVCPFCFISGNHEYYLGHNNEYAGLFSDYGGVVLENDVVSYEIKGVRVNVAGVSDPISTLPEELRLNDGVDLEGFEKNLDYVAQAIAELPDGVNILLAHRPEYIDLYKAPQVYDLILSGHAHGGQWRFPFINGLYAPGQGLFPKYAGGRYVFPTEQEGQTSVFIISRGLSYQKPLFPRFGNPVELVEILVQTEAFRK